MTKDHVTEWTARLNRGVRSVSQKFHRITNSIRTRTNHPLPLHVRAVLVWVSPEPAVKVLSEYVDHQIHPPLAAPVRNTMSPIHQAVKPVFCLQKAPKT